MNRLPLLTSTCVAALLGLVILVEIQTVGSPNAITPPPSAGPTPPSRGAGQSVVIPAALQQSWVTTILARPIFSPSRRPGAAAATSTELPRLAGIIIGPAGASAIFSSSDSRAIVAAAGMRAGPYLVRAVTADGVSVIGPGGPQVLHVTYDPNGSHPGVPDAIQPAASSSILDLLRARIQNGEGARGSMLPNFGAPAAGNPQK